MFDASNNPNVLTTNVTGLVPHKLYKFRVFAVDFNGLSDPSPIVEVYACGLPRDFGPPIYVASNQNSITITWDSPKRDGGCPIFDYKIERDEDGTGELSWTEVNPFG